MSEKEEKSATGRSSESDPTENSSGARHSSDSESNSSATITVLRPHDILLGRGSGCNDYEGNVRFRKLIEKRKREYLSAAKREDKRRIAHEIFGQITRNGGRFLQKEAKRKVNGVIVNRGAHVQVHNKVALEKVKQALRQNWQHWNSQNNDEDRIHYQNLPQPPFGIVPEVASANNGSAVQGFGFPQVNHFGNLSDHLQSTVNPPSAYAQLMIFQRAQLALQQQPALLRSLLLQQSVEPLTVTTSDQHAAVSQSRDLSDSVWPLGASLPSTHPSSVTTSDQHAAVSQSRDLSDSVWPLGASLPSTHPSSQHEFRVHPLSGSAIRPSSGQARLMSEVTQDSLLHARSGPRKEPMKEPSRSSDREDARVALDALSTLAMTGRPKFTDQQLSEELALLSVEERLQALMDKFGRLCITDQQAKKPRRDIDQASLSFLISQMKLELDMIPDFQKQAMLEANAKCRLDEFSDARLTQFLRSEGMNVKLAARRLAKYWECRKETFGPEKFTMRMTLTEALRDDLVAIEEGVMFLLPLMDLSGRLLLFIEPHRRRADRYSAESMLRAMWYILEVTAEKTTDLGSDCVLIAWDKTATIFDFPRATYDRIVEFEKTCLPVRFAAVHTCCPNAAMNFMRPIMLALTDTRTRARTIVHNVPESTILDALISYGISKEMVPTELGGTIVLNQREWMENRRAVEMEEL